MSDRLQRISDNSGRLYAVLLAQAAQSSAEVTEEEMVGAAVGSAIRIEQEVAKQTLAAFAPSRPCTCEEVPGDHARCPIHGES